MPNLKYEIGKVEMMPDRLGELHLFVVDGNSDRAEIYVSRDYSHSTVAKRYFLDPSKIVGGGLITLENSDLKIGGTSDKFGSIPEFAIKIFGKLVAKHLNSKEIEVRNISVNPSEDKIGIPEYWINPKFREDFCAPKLSRKKLSHNGYG